MPQTKTSRRTATRPRQSAVARKLTTARKPHATNGREPKQTRPVDRTVDLSEEVLRSLESGQRAAIDAVRKFVDTVDQKLPALGERPSRRQEIVDAAMEMADRLVHTQYDFMRDVVQSAGKALNRQDERR